MPDVGILNLQIHANTTEAEKKLDSLAAVLTRFKEAVQGGLKLTSIATGLEKIGKVVNDSISGSTIEKIGQLSEALSKLDGVGNVRIKIDGAGSANGIRDTLEECAGSMESTKLYTDELGNAFNDLEAHAVPSAEDVTKSVIEIGDGAGEAAKQIEELLNYLGQNVDYSNLRGVIDNVNGIGQSANVTKQELEVFVTESSRKLEELLKYLNQDIKYDKNRLAQFIDDSLGIGKKYTGYDDAKELLEHAEELEKAYRKLQEVRELKDRVFATSEKAGTFDGGIQAYIDRSLGIGADTSGNIENARNLLANADLIMDDVNAYHALKIAVDEVTDAAEKNMEKMEAAARAANIRRYNPASDSFEPVNLGAEAQQKQDAYFNHLDERLEWAKEHFKNSSIAIQNMIAEMFNMSRDDMFGPMAEQASSANEKIAWSAMKATDALKKLYEGVKKMTPSWGEFKKAISSMFPTLSNLLKRFKSMIIMRSIRYIIREISAGFREGVENVYRYSQAIGSSFAPAMDSAAASLLQMKNSIGAAVAPLLQSLIPVLESVVNWFIDMVNWANQFIALMRGQSTWTRAIKGEAKAFDDVEKSAKGAGSAMKDLLADWDELNIIQSQSGGTGAGVGADAMTDYLNMFEEVATFDQGVQNTVKWLKDNLDSIWTIAEGVGAAILAWKLSNAFGASLGLLTTLLGEVATFALVITLTDTFGSLYMSTGEPGYLIADALTGAVGSFAAWKIAKNLVGGELATTIGGLSLILSGVVDLKNARSISDQAQMSRSWWLGVLGTIKFGIGAALVAAGFGASVTASIVTGGIAIAGVALYFALDAILSPEKEQIRWGDKQYTHAQVQAFVLQEMFTVDVPAQLNLVNSTVTATEEEKTKITNQVNGLLAPVQSIILGVNTADSLEKIKVGVFGNSETGETGLIGQFKEYAKQQEILLETAFKIVPIRDESGNDVSGEYITSGIAGYNELTTIMDTLGNELIMHMTNAMDETLDAEMRDFEAKAAARITQTMVRVTAAVTSGEIEAAAVGELKLSLRDANRMTMEDILGTYRDYQDKLRTGYEEIYLTAAQSYAGQANAYAVLAEEALERGDNEAYRHYRQLQEEYEGYYTNLIDTMDKQVDAAVKQASSGHGKDMISELLLSRIDITDLPRNALGAVSNELDYALGWFIRGINDEVDKAELDKRLFAVFDQILKDTFSAGDYAVIKEAIDAGIISYGDIFGEEFIKNMIGSEYFHNYDYRMGPDEWKQPFRDKVYAEWESVCKDVEKNLGYEFHPEISFEFKNNGKDAESVLESLIPGIDKYVLDDKERRRLIDEANYAIDSDPLLQQRIEPPNIGGNGRVIVTTDRMMASAGMVSGVNFVSSGVNQNMANETVRTKDDESARNQEEGNGILNQILTVVRLINSKDFSVNVYPSSGWGSFNDRSADRLSKVSQSV